MIAANELRIGNYILLETGIDLPRWHCVKAKDIFDIQEGKVTLNAINPIKLTPKILEKCGFENKHAEYCEHYKKDKILIEIIPDGTYQARLEYNSSHSLWLIELASLHQLQNLYLDLIGEEIEIK